MGKGLVDITEGELVADFLGYWLHRLHHGLLWKTHAIHHSSPHLDWLASVRTHPLNVVAQRAPVAILLVLMGFDLAAIGGQLAGFGLLGIVVHMRVDWDWGPLRKVLVSPRFHRWHHSREVDCNYGGLFPVWDLVFGTYRAPTRIRVPAKLQMAWLCDPSTGSVWSHLQEHYELRESGKARKAREARMAAGA